MNPIEFLRTIYLGDRYCTKVVIDTNNNTFEFHVNLISRIRDESGEWNYHSDEDILNGVIVITGISKVMLDSSGLIPNDQIYDLKANLIKEMKYEFIFNVSHVDKNAITHDLILEIVGDGIYLFDPIKNVKVN